MIVSQRAKIACNIKHFLSQTTQNSLLNHFSFAFCDIKKKTDQFMCAATAIFTLTKSKSNSFMDSITNLEDQGSCQNTKIWLQKKQPFTLREKIVQNISQLQLYNSSNSKEILDLFKIDHSLGLDNLEIQSRIKDGAQVKKFHAEKKQKYFVFNPTFVFRELLSYFESYWPQRKILIGYYGIGKSSNQLLANILTTYLFKFRKQGEEKYLQESILRNIDVLKSIMGFTQQNLLQFKTEKQLVQKIKQEMFDIPFILYYSLPPQQEQSKKLDEVGFTQKDFIKYLTKQQIQKLPSKQCYYFCKQIERICRQNHIRMALVIDQSNFYFSTLRQLLFFQEKIITLQTIKAAQEQTLKELSKQAFLLRKNARIYGDFLNRVASIFKHDPNITLSCSQNVEYPFYPSRHFLLYNPQSTYSKVFFNRQYSKQRYFINYGRNRFSQVWQRDIDLVFWFQLESSLLDQFFKQVETKEQLQESDKIEALNYLKYYYFNLVFQGKLKTKHFWSDAARHLNLNKSLRGKIDSEKQSQQFKSKNIQSQKKQSAEVRSLKRTQIIQIEQIVAILIEQKRKMKIQYHQNQNALNKFAQNIKKLRQTVRQQCQINHIKQLSKFNTTNNTKRTKFMKSKFTIVLHSIVSNLQKSNNNQVVINDQQIQEILKQMKSDKTHIMLDEVINRSYMELKIKINKKTLIFNSPLEQIKKYLASQVTKINYELFLACLYLEGHQSQRYNVEKLLKNLLTTQKHEITINGKVQESFNIRNQNSLTFTSFLSLLRIQKDKEALFLKVIEQTNQKEIQQKYKKDGLWFWKQYQGQKEKQMKFSNDIQEIKIRSFQNVFRKWLIKYSQQLEDEQKGRTVETAWQHIFQLFKKIEKKENKAIQNVTFGASPKNLTSESKNKNLKKNAPNNPFFDLLLIKKNQQKENSKPYKVVAIDVTVGESNKNYETKLQNLIQFKKYIFLNHLEFFSNKELEIWILCPQVIAKASSQKWVKQFKKKQDQLDQRIKSKSDRLVLKILSVKDIRITGQNQMIGNYKLDMIYYFTQMMKKQE